jgi:hypothetical protein
MTSRGYSTGQDRIPVGIIRSLGHHHGFILVYDANQPSSFGQLQKWIQFARSVNSKEPVFMVMGILSGESGHFPQPVRLKREMLLS